VTVGTTAPAMMVTVRWSAPLPGAEVIEPERIGFWGLHKIWRQNEEFPVAGACECFFFLDIDVDAGRSRRCSMPARETGAGAIAPRLCYRNGSTQHSSNRFRLRG